MNNKPFEILNVSDQPAVTRRGVLKAGAGLSLAIAAGPMLSACADKGPVAGTLAPGPFLRIGNDDIVTVISRNSEIGQGTFTGIATLIAEELDADWTKVVVEAAPADPSKYANPGFGPMQGTGGSNAMASSWDQMRQAGAVARAMLVGAAAEQWGVPASEITVSAGVVSHAGKNKSARFGELAGRAAKRAVPKDVALKKPEQYVLIGKDAARVDARAKSTGTALYTQDVKLPDMQVALVIAPPRFGATLKSFDAAAAKAMAGVADVVQFKHSVRDGLAVIAKDYWTAKKAREAVKVEWDESKAYTQGTDQLFAEYKALAAKPGVEAKKIGDVSRAGAARFVEATYEFPYLSHAAMEPLNCVAQITKDGCEIWTGAQLQTMDQMLSAALLGIKPEQVRINTLFAGGSFGRRSNPQSDFVQEAVSIAKAWGTGKPVKLVWSREDDMHGGFYRPAFLHALKAGLDAKGNIVSWEHRIVGQSILEGTPLMPPGAPIDPLSIEGSANLPYDVPNLQVDVHTTKSPVTVQWWRSVGSTHSAYATENFLDEIARATGKDALELRRSLLAKQPRHLAVLNLAAEKAGWGSPLPAGKSRGIAVHECFGSVVAEVAEVSQVAPGKFKVDRVVCGVDCGLVLNPNIVAMQVESSIGLGLGAVMSGQITLKDGKVEQSNFHDYTVMRLNQMPKVDVHFVPGGQKPTGIGEPGLPPVGPAVAGAILKLTGKSLHNLPFTRSGISIV
ncbi:MAG: hypothetical protein RLZZ200_1484 [Pseudomonadota bacterium]|jgi:isoquinoline 1-oxidoreductase beta subunit